MPSVAPRERLLRVLVLEEGGERGALARLADVDVEDPVAVDERLRHVEPVAELVPGGVADRRRLEGPSGRLLERLPDLRRSERLLLSLVAGGAAPGQDDEGEDRKREQGDASHCAQRVAPRLNGGSRPFESSGLQRAGWRPLEQGALDVHKAKVDRGVRGRSPRRWSARGRRDRRRASGTADQVTFRTNNRVDTPSGSFINYRQPSRRQPGHRPDAHPFLCDRLRARFQQRRRIRGPQVRGDVRSECSSMAHRLVPRCGSSTTPGRSACRSRGRRRPPMNGR